MLSSSTTTYEEGRLAAVKSYNILDTAEEKDFDDLTVLASAICQTPIAFISLIDDKRQWFKSRMGIAETETPIELSICATTIVSELDILIVEDARQDERFAKNPMVTGATRMTFYAGVPLVNEDGFALGSLCVIDQHQKQLTSEQTTALKIIAKQVVDKLELRKKAIALEKIHQELIDSNLFIQKFAAMAAHDIKNPMTSILLTAQALQMRLKKIDDKSCERLIDLNITSTKCLMALLDDMIAYSKSPSLLLTQKQTVNLPEMMRKVISMINVPDNFTIQVPTENRQLNISSIAIDQIFINLLTNAIRYNDKEQGIINIRFSEDKDNYHFEIEDNGIGVAREYHEKIFNNNFTLKISDRYNKKGSGIGLSTVKELVKALNGTITLKSEPGKGTTFYISLNKL
ncbi:GAF domain-containing sensor histidine kinase [uncultured Mucilaginibacter sp.]|uniref:sensor histidine kinase n=1 Tax=uncultured Mucilaginibacter sp. TaxID=797541 RepID=UPI0025F39179|nr:GAF domain-containing sensor histidine kinase [uncultured Mucilaginibacter sp.]